MGIRISFVLLLLPLFALLDCAALQDDRFFVPEQFQIADPLYVVYGDSILSTSFHLGTEKLKVKFDSCSFDSNTDSVSVSGQIFLRDQPFGSNLRIVISENQSTSPEIQNGRQFPRFVLANRVQVLINQRGQFRFTAKVKPNSNLIVSAPACFAQIYAIGKLATR